MKKLLTAVMSVLIIGGATLLLSACNGDGQISTFNSTITLNQNGTKQEVNVSWDAEEIVEKVEITINHNDNLVSKKVITDKKTINEGKVAVDAFYGKHNVKVSLFSKNKISIKNGTVSLFANEYNIAPISGTMPVLLFTLSNWDITTDSQGNPIPTFCWFERPTAWDWGKLPSNIYPMPNASNEEVLKQWNKGLMLEKTNEYIKELYSINPDSKFNVYLNDYDVVEYFRLVVANDLKNYNVYFLSDGSHSYGTFNRTYNVENATEKHAQMVQNYNTLVGQVKETKAYNSDFDYAVNVNDIQGYCYLISTLENNVEWWLSRANRTSLFSISSDTSNFMDTFINSSNAIVNSSVKVKAIGSLLTSIQNNGHTQDLKALYKFSDDMFSAAEEQNKKVMVILGSYADEAHEPNFADYVNFIKTYYGDEYVYYYKGHPNTPTNLHPAKVQQLKDLGLYDVESTIAAELILFFNPDIYMCGYDSTTFLSVQSKEMACGVFDMTKAEGITKSYGQLMNMFMSKVSAHGTKYDSIINLEHNNYVIEFNDTTVKEFAIYDATENTITNYKTINNEFVVV